ncbi:unknown [Anaerotruncus sp. CAG:390]|nr:unknown [Anaerotruncus sp. CAG:390]
MKKKIVTLAAAMAVLFAALTLAACKPEGGAEATTPVSTAEPAPADFAFVKDGASEFRIVRPASDSSDETEAAKELRKKIEEKTGYKMELYEDWYAKSQAPSKYEILIGHTDLDESVAVNGEIDGEDGFFYVIRSVGDKIVLTGKSANMIRKGIDFILENYTDESGNIMIPHDINIKSEMYTPAVADYFGDGKDVTLTSALAGAVNAVDGCKVIQGGTTDGKYLYVITHNGDKTINAESILQKIDIKTMKTVARSERLRVSHGNDIVYKKNTNELLVVHCYPDGKMVSVFDADTLKFKRKIELPISIYCMSYDESLDCYWVGVSGGDTFAKLDADFKFVKRYMSQMHDYVTQGMDCDDTYLYFVRYKKNCVIVYTKDGGYVGEYPLTFPGEPENICHIGDYFYVVGNNSNWSGGVILKVKLSAK